MCNINGFTGPMTPCPRRHGLPAVWMAGAVRLRLNLGARFTDVPGGTATWTFTGGTNYNNQSGDAAIVINKADATVTVNGFSGTL